MLCLQYVLIYKYAKTTVRFYKYYWSSFKSSYSCYPLFTLSRTCYFPINMLRNLNPQKLYLVNFDLIAVTCTILVRFLFRLEIIIPLLLLNIKKFGVDRKTRPSILILNGLNLVVKELNNFFSGIHD